MSIKKTTDGRNSFFYLIIFLAIFCLASFLGFYLTKEKAPAFFRREKTVSNGSNVSGEEPNSVSEHSTNLTKLKPVAVYSSVEREAQNIISEIPAAANSEFSNCLFIGDSLTLGLEKQTYLTYNNVIALDGLSISDFFDFEGFASDHGEGDELITAAARVEELHDNPPDRVYIMLGLHSLDALSVDDAISQYLQVVQFLKKIFPKTDLYIESVLPHSTADEFSSPISTDNQKIADFNTRILDLCVAEKLYFLDIASILVDSNGELLKRYTTDGYQLTKEAYDKWENFLKTHIVMKTN